MSFGVAGKLATIDLSSGDIEVENLNPELVKRYLGGFGLCVRIAYDHIRPGVDPLSPENPVIIGTGVLVGTNVPAASRVYTFTKLPANNAVGWGGGGGVTFGCNLKFAGYDCLVIRGKAESPVIIKIEDENVEICKAEDLWGLGVGETTENLRSRFGQGGVLSIGQAGENLVRFSMAYIDRLSTVGRGGIGAVLGSKKLKAIFVMGNGEIGVADRERFNRICANLLERMRKYPHLKEWQELGLLKSLPALPEDEYFRIRKKRIACVSCPVGDKDEIEIDGNRIHTTSVVNLLTPVMMGMKDYRKAMKLTAILDDYGMDMFEFFGVLSFAKELEEEGIIELEEKIDLSSFESLSGWAERVCLREGMGNLLAEGIGGMERKFGEAKNSIKGMMAYVTPKGPLVWDLFGTMELGQVIDPRGPHVAAHGSPTYFARRPSESFVKHLRRMGLDDEKIGEILEGGLRVGKLLCYSNLWFVILASLGICARAQINRFYSAELCAELYSAVTGMEVTKEEMMGRAKEIWTLLKLANVREGFRREHDSPPDDWFEDGFRDYVTGKPLAKEDVERMVDEYYREMGWDFM
ncbi:aldehyde ferredoxin oxidoreductase N-terminal domain-containing protein [Archaeoglobus neptunius]|uniref:aldehyde ferredoxin oxidoreductase N-terminal domain-containing protein n=1 Tax=Archaeoglobus neptunius TaxID=2798580 RepID=UPI001929223B